MDHSTQDGLTIHPIFTGLTRPPMFLGVTVDYLSVCLLTTLCAFILADEVVFLLAYLPLHVFGWVACKIDHNIFRILMKRGQCAYSPNQNVWGCHSYEPF